MTFDLRAILIFVIAAFLYAGLLPRRLRTWALLIGSVMAICWLQPPLSIRFNDFILPTIILGLAVSMWWFSRDPQNSEQIASLGEDRHTLLVIVVVVLALSFNRFLPAEWRFTPSRPPEPLMVLLALGTTYLIVAGVDRLVRHRHRWHVLTGAMFVVIGIFVVLKTELVATEASRVWRALAGQDTTLASPIDLNWLGFSYVAFRLIHTLRDRQTGILPVLSLREYVTYVIFAPPFIAGPIDRAERFVVDYRALPDLVGLDAARFIAGGRALRSGSSRNSSSPTLWRLACRLR